MKRQFILILLAAALAAVLGRTADDTMPSRSSPHFAGLGDLTGGSFFSVANSLSDDGTIVFGYSSSTTGMEACRWSQLGGIEGLGFPHGSAKHDVYPQFDDARGIYSRWEKHAANADGTVTVGAIRRDSGHHEACRWTLDDDPRGLGLLPGHCMSVANAVSNDGSVVVGRCSNYLTSEPFRWTHESGMERLGPFEGKSRNGSALGVSADGSVIVGYVTGADGWEAFIWDAANGMRSVRDVLIRDYHLDDALRGWKLRCAMAVSPDGTVVVGFGSNPHGSQEAWIARPSANQSIDEITATIASQVTARNAARR